MTSRLFTLKPDDTVADAMQLMHEKHVRNLPVVDDSGVFVGLFGLRRLSHLLLPIAASELGRYSLHDLHFLPDESVLVGDRWHDIANHPVVDYLEKKKKLLFCTPDTKFPELLALFEESKDTTLPVIIVKGKKKKLVGVVSPWDILESVILGGVISNADDPDTR
jgi:CBS domain-containing protein